MMSKKKKRAKRTAPVGVTPGGAVKAQLKKFNWRRALVILLSTIAAFAIYEALITTEFLTIGGIPLIMPVYFIIATVLIFAVLLLNHGISQKEVTPDMFKEEYKDMAEELSQKINRHKAIARKLMLILLPFLFAIFFDIIYLFYGDILRNALSLVFGGA